MTNPTRIQIRRGTTTQWDNSPTLLLASGEIGFVESGADKGKFKIGDGSTQWSLLNYYPLVSDLSDFATETYVSEAIAGILEGAPETLSTLNDLAAALGDNANFATSITTLIGEKLPLAGGTMTGTIAMGTNKVTGLGAPTDNNDAATKLYVDTLQTNVETNYSLATHTHNFNSLTDFEITTPVGNGEIFMFDETGGKWKNTVIDFQPRDNDLTSIAALSGTSGFLKKTAADTWTLDTTDYLPTSSGLKAIFSGSYSATGSWTDVTGMTLTIPATTATSATYLVMATVTLTTTTTAGDHAIRIWNGTDIYASTQTRSISTNAQTISANVHAIVTVPSNTAQQTFRLSVRSSSAFAIQPTTPMNAAGGLAATMLSAIKIA